LEFANNCSWVIAGATLREFNCSLDKYKFFLEHDLAKHYEDGKVVILLLALCREHDLMRHVHVSPLVIAPKGGKLSRVCLNLSFTGRQHDEIFPSSNDGVRQLPVSDDEPSATILVEEIPDPCFLRWFHR
jgi:hypothetical protein